MFLFSSLRTLLLLVLLAVSCLNLLQALPILDPSYFLEVLSFTMDSLFPSQYTGVFITHDGSLILTEPSTQLTPTNLFMTPTDPVPRTDPGLPRGAGAPPIPSSPSIPAPVPAPRIDGVVLCVDASTSPIPIKPELSPNVIILSADASTSPITFPADEVVESPLPPLNPDTITLSDSSSPASTPVVSPLNPDPFAYPSTAEGANASGKPSPFSSGDSFPPLNIVESPASSSTQEDLLPPASKRFRRY